MSNIKVLPLKMYHKLFLRDMKYYNWTKVEPKYFYQSKYYDGCCIHIEWQDPDGCWWAYETHDKRDIKVFTEELELQEMLQTPDDKMAAMIQCVKLGIGPREWGRVVYLYHWFHPTSTYGKRQRLERMRISKRLVEMRRKADDSRKG